MQTWNISTIKPSTSLHLCIIRLIIPLTSHTFINFIPHIICLSLSRYWSKTNSSYKITEDKHVCNNIFFNIFRPFYLTVQILCLILRSETDLFLWTWKNFEYCLIKQLNWKTMKREMMKCKQGVRHTQMC